MKLLIQAFSEFLPSVALLLGQHAINIALKRLKDLTDLRASFLSKALQLCEMPSQNNTDLFRLIVSEMQFIPKPAQHESHSSIDRHGRARFGGSHHQQRAGDSQGNPRGQNHQSGDRHTPPVRPT